VLRSDGTRQASSPRAQSRIAAVVCFLSIIALCSSAEPTAAAQPYKDRQVAEVLREFQRQGARVVFSSALVTPHMRVVEEPPGDDPEDIITAILAPHDLTLRVGLRGILLVVLAASVAESNAGGRAAVNPRTARSSRHP
jgi:hypothetical protein